MRASPVDDAEPGMSETVADAWAAVILSIHDRLEAERKAASIEPANAEVGDPEDACPE